MPWNFINRTVPESPSINEEQKEHTSPYALAYFVLNAPRPLLYERIDTRVDEMLKNGLTEEVKKLREMGCHRGNGFHAGAWL